MENSGEIPFKLRSSLGFHLSRPVVDCVSRNNVGCQTFLIGRMVWWLVKRKTRDQTDSIMNDGDHDVAPSSSLSLSVNSSKAAAADDNHRSSSAVVPWAAPFPSVFHSFPQFSSAFLGFIPPLPLAKQNLCAKAKLDCGLSKVRCHLTAIDDQRSLHIYTHNRRALFLLQYRTFFGFFLFFCKLKTKVAVSRSAKIYAVAQLFRFFLLLQVFSRCKTPCYGPVLCIYIL